MIYEGLIVYDIDYRPFSDFRKSPHLLDSVGGRSQDRTVDLLLVRQRLVSPSLTC